MATDRGASDVKVQSAVEMRRREASFVKKAAALLKHAVKPHRAKAATANPGRATQRLISRTQPSSSTCRMIKAVRRMDSSPSWKVGRKKGFSQAVGAGTLCPQYDE